MDVRHVKVGSNLCSVEALAGAGRPVDHGLEGFEFAFLTELLLDLLDVGLESVLAVPLEVDFLLLTLLGDASKEELRRSDLQVQKQRLSPIDFQLQRRFLWVVLLEHGRHWVLLNQAGADALRNCFHYFTLGRPLHVVDRHDVLLVGLCFVDFFDNTSKVLNVDARHQVSSFAYVRKLLRILEPSLLEMLVKDVLSISVKHS